MMNFIIVVNLYVSSDSFEFFLNQLPYIEHYYIYRYIIIINKMMKITRTYTRSPRKTLNSTIFLNNKVVLSDKLVFIYSNLKRY